MYHIDWIKLSAGRLFKKYYIHYSGRDDPKTIIDTQLANNCALTPNGNTRKPAPGMRSSSGQWAYGVHEDEITKVLTMSIAGAPEQTVRCPLFPSLP